MTQDFTPANPQVPAGWHQDPSNPALLRYWDGFAWTDHTAPAHQPPQAAPQFVQQAPMMSVTATPAKTSHTFHLIMSILTCGLWAIFVWAPIGAVNAFRKEKSVTHYR